VGHVVVVVQGQHGLAEAVMAQYAAAVVVVVVEQQPPEEELYLLQLEKSFEPLRFYKHQCNHATRLSHAVKLLYKLRTVHF
jgi:hypothetical protein